MISGILFSTIFFVNALFFVTVDTPMICKLLCSPTRLILMKVALRLIRHFIICLLGYKYFSNNKPNTVKLQYGNSGDILIKENSN